MSIIRNVPDDLYRKLKMRAAELGMTLSDYLLAEARQLAERQTLQEVLVQLDREEPLTPEEVSAEIVCNRIAQSQGNVHVPHLFDLEVVHVFRRYERRGLVPVSRLERAFARLQSLRLVRYPHVAFLEQVWRLRANVTAYDAAYLTLAEALTAPLVTTDGRLSRVPGLRATVEFCGEEAS